jgi:hypothetical protein
LEGVLLTIAPTASCHFLVFEGKQDLERHITKRLRGWQRPNTFFVVIRDQDSSDCLVLKRRLLELCQASGKNNFVVRIACRELESFFLGDWAAIAQAYGRPELTKHQRAAKFRDPDRLGSPSAELKALLTDYQKRDGARRISRQLDPVRNRSRSFQVLVRELKRLNAVP